MVTRVRSLVPATARRSVSRAVRCLCNVVYLSTASKISIVATLQALAESKSLETINIQELVAAGFVSPKHLVKILANGTLTAKLTVEAHAFSQKAVEAIEAVGGTVVKL